MAHSFSVFNLKSRRHWALLYSIAWTHYHGDIFFTKTVTRWGGCSWTRVIPVFPFPSRAANPNMGHLFMPGQQPDAFKAAVPRTAQSHNLRHNSPPWTTHHQFHPAWAQGFCVLEPWPSHIHPSPLPKPTEKPARGFYRDRVILLLRSFSKSSDAFFYDLEKVTGSPLDCNSSSVMAGLLFSWHAKVLWGLIH